MTSTPPGPRATRELEPTTVEDLSSELEGAGRARLVWKLLRNGKDPFESHDLSRPLAGLLRSKFHRTHLAKDRVVVSDCGTTKLSYRLKDETRIETVLIPTERRTTVCISTQVGCARGCIFCATATMGLMRGLSAGEIVAQVTAALAETNEQGLPPVRNIVFMGMGEPLDNLGAVRQAVDILCDDRTLGIAGSHITLSTVGPSPEAVLASRDIPVRLAWSLHAVDETLRKTLIPTAKFSPTILREAFLERSRVSSTKGRSLFIEVTLIDGMNDSSEQADAMAEFLEPFPPGIRVNLLPMNPASPARKRLAPTSDTRAQRFRQRLRDCGYFCDIRVARGASNNSACGQLVTATEDRPLNLDPP